MHRFLTRRDLGEYCGFGHTRMCGIEREKRAVGDYCRT